VVLLREGKLVVDATVDEFRHSRSEAVAEFLGGRLPEALAGSAGEQEGSHGG
jgi:hypothetical protein